MAKTVKKSYIATVGRRKTAVARVRLFKDGEGKIEVNKLDYKEYFPELLHNFVINPLVLVDLAEKINVTVKVVGGGKKSQAESVRLGIARALYKNPKILILDEATNSLDEHTENLILEKLFNKITNKTILTISHRSNSLKHCNKVIEVKDGSIYSINFSYKISPLDYLIFS